jgi:hypothetical protein
LEGQGAANFSGMTRIFLVAALLLTAFCAIAQPELERNRPTKGKKEKPKVTFGLRLGGSLSTLYSPESAIALQKQFAGNASAIKSFTTAAAINPAAGVYLSFVLSKHIAFTPEVLLALVGANNKYEVRYKTTSQDVANITQLNYLQIPLLLEFSFGEKAVQPFIKIGGTPAYLVKGLNKNTTIDNNASTTTTTNEPLNNTVTRSEGGATVGAGLHLGRFFDLEARYNFGLTNLSDDSNSILYNAKNKAVGLTLGVKF